MLYEVITRHHELPLGEIWLLDIDDILSTYKGGGASSYHPRVMIKILFYSYLNNVRNNFV